MNKYLEKVAEILSDDDKQVAKTFAIQSAAGIPAHILGGAAGGALGAKYLGKPAKSVNNAFGRAGDALRKKGKYGSLIGRKLRNARGVTGATLGVGLGMSAIGGLADLAALKHGMSKKVEKQ